MRRLDFRATETYNIMMNKSIRVRLAFFICSFLVAALLCLYFMISPTFFEKWTITHREHNLTQELIAPSPAVDNTPEKPAAEKSSNKSFEKSPKKLLPSKKPPRQSAKLPQSVIDGVKTFVFFVGHPCSGHSIVGSLIDSHPHMVVSNEYTLFWKLSKGALAPNKSKIFNALWNFDLKMKSRTEDVKGYTLVVDGLYEGKYVDHIDVIGDKRGDRTIQLFIDHPSNWSSVYNILKSLNVTLKVIHVIRNPYNNIASLIFLSDNKKYSIFKKIKHSNETYTFNSNYTAKWIKTYFQYHQAIVSVKEKYKLHIIEVHDKDLISDSKGTLLRLCNQLGVTCSNDYLEKCSKKIYKDESRTRHLLNWTKQQLELIEQNIKKYSCLKGYTFDSM